MMIKFINKFILFYFGNQSVIDINFILLCFFVN